MQIRQYPGEWSGYHTSAVSTGLTGLVTNLQQTPPARFYAGIFGLAGQTARILVMQCGHFVSN